ncbi:acyl-ACP thioesterase [Dysgonomonas alginatilytica]|uniref:Acyl-ACP thioesterase n=1 Tax=Dysgonomonas alginatilytica TaxID=1605892 RepID=A0A2V3PKT3_9BACT|nr:acyl-ACP thioesterase domain-containing protein [Dysgonomonas alginatilytica]PXV60044.1 acyl-ACP thioesterase [Dysgonomonas alginatilytica]
MTSKEGIYTYTIDAYLSDFRGKATLPMLGGFMLQAATRHAEERNFGYSFMSSQQRAWVLMRMSIELSEYPNNDTSIKLHTWVSDINKLFSERCFAFEDQDGNYIGYARSMWASIDLETRHPTNILDLERMTELKSDKVCPIPGAVKIPFLKDGESAASFTVKYSDIDINKHLNSMKYIEHFIDIFPIEMFQEKEIKTFEMNYLAEGQYGTTLDILKKETELDTSVLEMKHNDKTICLARVTWQ